MMKGIPGIKRKCYPERASLASEGSFRWLSLLLALFLAGCVRPAPIPRTPSPTVSIPPILTAAASQSQQAVGSQPVDAQQSPATLPGAEEETPAGAVGPAAGGEQAVTDPVYGYTFTLPGGWLLCGSTSYSRLYCAPGAGAPASQGPGVFYLYPSFYLTVVPDSYASPDDLAFNRLHEYSIRGLQALSVGSSLSIPGWNAILPDGTPAPGAASFKRLPDIRVAGRDTTMFENQAVPGAPAGMADRRALFRGEGETILFGTYYHGPEELDAFEEILASFQLVSPGQAEAAAPALSTATIPTPAARQGVFLPLLLHHSLPERALADRPDEVSGYQVHVLYVLPADGQDRQLDLDGTLDSSLGSLQNWLGEESGGSRLRLDTFGGTPDITFYRLSRSDAEIASEGVFVRDVVQRELASAGFDEPHKLYAVYYDGTSQAACGGGAWPPSLVGNVAMLYLQGLPDAEFPCRLNAFAPTPLAPPGYLEMAMLHEIFHTLGAVPACAPHQTRQGHVSDSNTDLMYAGDLSWVPLQLDTGRDDYWDHGQAGCLDLSRSAFLDPLPEGAQAPPGWP